MNTQKYSEAYDPDFGFMLPEPAGGAVVQKNGCKYDKFVFQLSNCKTVWMLRWRRTNPDGTVLFGRHLMSGDPSNVVETLNGDAK